MERQHFPIDEMNRAVGLPQAGLRQVDVAERIGVYQSVTVGYGGVIGKRGIQLNNIRDVVADSTTVVQNRFLILSARRQPTITAPELVRELQRVYNVTVGCNTVRNLLDEANI